VLIESPVDSEKIVAEVIPAVHLRTGRGLPPGCTHGREALKTMQLDALGPGLGRHNDEVYKGWLGMSYEQIGALEKENVI
jgi:crotonobetainyl-CoA:carnitine CoA-transferase CaiB-like acyl-CoA transferase